MTWTLYSVQKTCSYLLVAIAFLTLWLGGSVAPVVTLVCLGAGGISWFCELPRVDPDDYAPLWRPLTLSLLVLLGGATIAGFLGPFNAGIGLVLYLTGAKLFQRQRAADYIQIMVLSFLLMALATIFNEDISFGLLFIFYVVVGLICLTLYHLRIQIETYPQITVQALKLGPKFIGGLVGLAGLALVISVVFFFAFPRVGFGFLSQQSRSGVMTTGFSEEVSLGSFGTLKTDPTVIMRVEFPTAVPTSTSFLHWRGISFDAYDGRSWSRTLLQKQTIYPDDDGNYRMPADRLSDATLTTLKAADPPLLQQTIFLEPLNSKVLFGLYPLTALNVAPESRTTSLLVSETGDVSHRILQQISHLYTTTSIIPQYQPEQLRTIDHSTLLERLPSSHREAYLQLPPDFNPEIKRLAETITAEFSTDFDRVLGIQQYLLDNYGYSLDIPDPGNQPPLDSFLFEHQRGHCEYFSTAMAIMLRSIDIPTRSVNGFLGGRWNEANQYLAVRNADAHSWVEVPFGSYGWVTFDPTPPAANVSQVEHWLDPLRNVYDALRFQWLKYVIQYDLQAQLQILQRATASLESLRSQDSGSFDFKDILPRLRASFNQNLIPLLGMIAAIVGGGVLGYRRQHQPIKPQDLGFVTLISVISGSLVGFLWQPASPGLLLLTSVISPSLAFAWMRWLAWLRQSQQKAQLQAISRFYLQIRNSLAEQGLTLKPYDGPEAVISCVQQSQLAEKEVVMTWIQYYMAIRFGYRTLDPKELNQMQADFERLRKSWKTTQTQVLTAP